MDAGLEAYEVWDLVSGNAIADFDTEDEALVFLRGAVTQLGRDLVADWGLARPGASPLAGAALVDLALQPIQP
jgi:hypothetical protein